MVGAGPAPMGPFALGDLIGLDTLASIGADLERAYGTASPTAACWRRWSRRAVSAVSRAAGSSPPGRRPAPVDAAARAAAAAYYAEAVDEARRCRDEGVAAPGDIDVALRLGAGWSEGPLDWSDDS